VEGGTSIFVDGFNAATQLRNTNQTAFNILASTPVPFKYIFDGHHVHHEHPTIELDPFSPGTIKYINYAPPFQAPLYLSTPPEFYTALKSLDGLLHKPQNAYQYQLEEGDAVIFDNRRVLHARTAFQERNVSGNGEQTEKGVNRWLQGCYFESETMQSRGRVLRAQREQGLI
jgi:gamma-butyrobetaine dioxygenase